MGTIDEALRSAQKTAKTIGQGRESLTFRGAQIKAQGCAQAFSEKGSGSIHTRYGSVDVGHVGYDEDTASVEVWLGDKVGAPAYRVVNPPVLVQDPSGDIEIMDGQGKAVKYKEDPVTALGEVLLQAKRGRR